MTTIYLVPHSHYDVAWAFTKEDYLNIHEIVLKKALHMVRESDFRFLVEQTYLLEQIEYRDPELFLEIADAIADGKLEIVDGQYLMPDPMIPYGEVLIREILFGKRYCREKFGIEVPVAWASDGFGLNAQMPQIYKKSGYRWLAFRRGLPKSIGTRVSEFVWEGLDGSQIVSHWMPLGYRAGLDIDRWEEGYGWLSQVATTHHILMPCGSGGVMPQEDIPEKVAQWNQEHEETQMVIATPSDFFRAFEQEDKELITFQGELYSGELESIFPDVVSSRIRLKLAIRESENALILAEKLATLAWLHGTSYPTEILTDLWERMLFLDFHDVVPSCGIDDIYNEAWEYINDISKSSQTIIRDSIDYQIEDNSHGSALAVFNPNNWEVTDWAEAEVKLGAGWSTEPGVALNEREIPSQAVELGRWDDGSVRRAKIGFVATVPALGYRVYQITKKSKNFKSQVKVSGNEVFTKFFHLAIDEKTGILQVFNNDGQEILKGNEVIIDEEIGDLYFHESKLNKPIGAESGGGIRFGAFRPEGLTIERGPLRTIITFKDAFYCLRWPYYLIEKYDPVLYRHKSVDICKRVIVYNTIPRIDFVTTLNLEQSHVRIRLKFDTDMVAPMYTRQTQFGVLELPQARTLEEGVKMPSLTWITAEEGDRGLAFMTHGVPINEIKGGEIYLTLLRSVSVLSADGVSGPLVPTPGAMELGEHYYSYSVIPYTGDWKKAGIHRRGSEFSQALLALQVDTEPHHKEYQGFSLEPDNLIISALKKAEQGNAVILRFFETIGEGCQAVLRVPSHIRAATVVNLLEEGESELAIHNGKLRMEVGPFEIVTLKLFIDERFG
jgi:alpha-mannosidase